MLREEAQKPTVKHDRVQAEGSNYYYYYYYYCIYSFVISWVQKGTGRRVVTLCFFLVESRLWSLILAADTCPH